MKEFADPNRSDNAERFAEHQLKHGCDCGTSPCAHQVSAIHADNAALRARVAELQKELEDEKVRKGLCCAENENRVAELEAILAAGYGVPVSEHESVLARERGAAEAWRDLREQRLAPHNSDADSLDAWAGAILGGDE